MAITINKVKPKLEGRIAELAAKAGIKESSKEVYVNDKDLVTRDFVYDFWLEMEGHRLSKKVLNRFAELIIGECNLKVKNYISDCGEIASLPDSVLLEGFK